MELHEVPPVADRTCGCGGLHQVTLDCRIADTLDELLPRLTSALERFEHPRPVTAALTRQEAADELRVSVRQVASMLSTGELRCVRLRTKVVIPRSEITRLLALDEPAVRAVS